MLVWGMRRLRVGGHARGVGAVCRGIHSDGEDEKKERRKKKEGEKKAHLVNSEKDQKWIKDREYFSPVSHLDCNLFESLLSCTLFSIDGWLLSPLHSSLCKELGAGGMVAC
jgi:hypothetical protein